MKLDIEGTLDITIFKNGKKIPKKEEIKLLNERLLYFGLESRHI